MLKEVKTQWLEASKIIKSINIISLVLLSCSLLFFTITLINNNHEIKIAELEKIQSSLKIIEGFDQKFPGKWRHYLGNELSISDLKSDLDELSLSNIKITFDNETYSLSGQIVSIKELLNLITYTYNFRGLVVNHLSVDVISEDLINIDLSLIF